MSGSLWLITYDIADPKRWRKVFRLLKSYGSPVQLSVFECRITSSQQRKMWDTMQNIVDIEEDRVNAYPICGQCDSRGLLLGHATRSKVLPVVWVVSDA